MPRFPIRLCSCALLLAGCGQDPPPPREAPRPVEVYELSEVDPSKPLRLTGSVTSWKEQEVAFEVGGRIEYVQEPGTLLEGRWEEDGKVRIEGQVLAELDERPYRIAVAQAEAALSVAEEKINVVEARIEKQLPANLRAATAEKDFAEMEYQRVEEAGRTDAVSELDVLRAKASRDVALASVQQAEAAFASQEAEKRSLEANRNQAAEQLEDTKWQRDRCKLFAPFTGEVSEVFVEAGGFVQPGNPVANLVMMDPVQVDVAVSAGTLRALERYAEVQLTVPGIPEPVSGRIYDLATAADPKTRTFRVSIIVRNQRRIGTLAPGDPDGDLPTVRRLLVPLKVDTSDPQGAWYVESRHSLHQDDEGWFVWAGVEAVGSHNLDSDRPVFAVRKLRVTPGERERNYQGIYVMRELLDAGELTENTLLPLGLPVDFPEGGKVLYDDQGWVLRPGQVISILLAEEAPTPGLFLPMNAVLPEDKNVGRVFVVEDGKAHAVLIDLGERAGPLVRVSASDPAEASRVGAGARIVRQAHFLHEGESVRIVRTHEVRP